MIDPPVTKARNVEGVVGLEGVRVHNAVRQDPLPDDRQQGLGPGVGDDGGEDPASALEKPEDGNLAACAPAPPALAPATEVTLVGLHFAGQLVAGLLAGDEPAQAHEEPDCRVGLHPDQLRRRPCRGPRDKQLDEFTLLTGCQSAFSLIHRSHYNPL